MRTYFSILPLLYFFQLSSCSDEKTTEKKDVEKNYFFDSEVPDSAIDFKNEMATGETDFLRSLSTHQIAWQKWNHEILKKAKDAQRPIFALLCSPLGSASRTVVDELNESQDLRGIISTQAVCTVIDSTVNPEMANLGYRLSAEDKKSAAFPMIIWLSHEGSPIASDPVGNISGRELKVIVSNLANVVEDLWTKSSRYTVENSRSENEKRQLRLKPNIEELKRPITRNELFQREARQLSSLYSFGDKNLDFIGGLIPSSSIELLAIGSHSASLTREVREQSREAAKIMTLELTSGALKDHLTGSYFYARRTDDWTLPFFSKDLLSQAKVAATLMRVGNLIGDEKFTKQGLELLELLETEWLAKEISSKCPDGNADIAGAFLWDYRTLKKILNPEQLKVATIAFSLEPTGNIPLERRASVRVTLQHARGFGFHPLVVHAKAHVVQRLGVVLDVSTASDFRRLRLSGEEAPHLLHRLVLVELGVLVVPVRDVLVHGHHGVHGGRRERPSRDIHRERRARGDDAARRRRHRRLTRARRDCRASEDTHARQSMHPSPRDVDAMAADPFAARRRRAHLCFARTRWMRSRAFSESRTWRAGVVGRCFACG